MTSRRRLVTAAALAALVLGAAPAADAYTRPGTVERVSVKADGSDPQGGDSWHADLSDDGRLVAFGSQAALVASDTNDKEDIYLRDRTTGALTRISVSASGGQGNGTSYLGDMTADGRYVAFTSHATTLVPGDTNGVTDIFVKDTTTGAIARASVNSAGTQTERRAFDPAISDDGRYVAFISGSITLDPPDTNGGCDTAVEGDSQGCDVFVHDMVTGRTERVSEGPGGEQGNGPSGWNVGISGDGRYVSFYSWATFAPPDQNQYSDIFVKDRLTGNIEQVHVSTHGQQGNAGATDSAISASGRYVVFSTQAANLVPTDTNTWEDTFVHDRITRVTERVSVSNTGVEGNLSSAASGITPDGRFVLMTSIANNLVPGDTNGLLDVFVHDRLLRTTERVSTAADGTQANGHGFASRITSDGSLVSFDSSASNLDPNDDNGRSDTFVRYRGPAVGIGDLAAVANGSTLEVSGWAGLAGTVLTSATDPPFDGGSNATTFGADLTGASIIQRPEAEDLLVRLGVQQMTGIRGNYRVPGIASPGGVFGLKFTAGGERYEVRAARITAASPAGAPYLALWDCTPSCTEKARLSGGIGTSGDEVLVSLPPSLIGAVAGTTLTNVEAFSGIGEPSRDSISVLDRIGVGSVEIAATTVDATLADAGETTVGTASLTLNGAMFDGSIDVSSLSAGTYTLTTTACVGTTCGSRSTEVVLG